MGDAPLGVAFNPAGTVAYVTNLFSNDVTPIDTSTNIPGTPIPVGNTPFGLVVNPAGTVHGGLTATLLDSGQIRWTTTTHTCTDAKTGKALAC